MQGIWYGDRRDRVKWGALLHLANSRAIPRIVQVAYYRDGPAPMLQTEEREIPLLAEVWDHFSDLRHIGRLGDKAGKEIIVLDQPYDPARRREYIAAVLADLKKIEPPRIVFLDPDTGIEPASAKPEHATRLDIAQVWADLVTQDVLAIYQHADRTKTWRDDRARTMADACEKASVRAIVGTGVASDVAVLWCSKDAAI